MKEKKIADKGGKNCDILLMSATPIPRTLTMSIYGDMDISITRENQIIEKKLKLIVNQKVALKM